jgi:hypothetical protein
LHGLVQGSTRGLGHHDVWERLGIAGHEARFHCVHAEPFEHPANEYVDSGLREAGEKGLCELSAGAPALSNREQMAKTTEKSPHWQDRAPRHMANGSDEHSHAEVDGYVFHSTQHDAVDDNTFDNWSRFGNDWLLRHVE